MTHASSSRTRTRTRTRTRAPRLSLALLLTLAVSAQLGLGLAHPQLAQAQATPKPASAVDACIQASEDTQRERARGHLRAARARSAECLDARCPTPIRHDCDTQAREIERLLPTLVFRVRGPDGADIPAANITIDGALQPNALDGRTHEIDPGNHEVTATASGYAPAHLRVVVEEGVQARVVELRPVSLAATSTASATPAHSTDERAATTSGSTPSTATWIGSGTLAGIGVVGLGLFTGLGLSADARYRELRDTCGSACDPSDADAVRRRFQVADIALGVGLVALAGAVIVYLVGPRDHEAPRDARR